MAKSLFIAETQNYPAKVLDCRLALQVPQRNLIEFVDTAVDFDNQSKALTGKIYDVVANRMLPPELVPVDLTRTDESPDLLLSKAGRLSQSSGDRSAIQSSLFPSPFRLAKRRAL